MSTRSVILDEEHFRVAEAKARVLGKTPEQYLQALIDADSQSFDDILEPVRRGFDSMSDSEIDDLFDRARKAARQSGE
jgi:hypothetical protein